MGQIYSGIRSIAEERAKSFVKTEKIFSEVRESVVDDLFREATDEFLMESSVDSMTDEELDELLNELPSDASDEKAEIARILAANENDGMVDLDDALGIIETLD